MINEICNNVQGLLIGRVYSASTMGYYSKARSTEKLASNTLTQALKQVTFPLYSELQNDKQGLIQAIKKLTQLISFFTFPLMLMLILLAEPIFVLLYSERWLDSVPYFKILCLAGIPGCLQSVNLQSIAAIGKSKVSFGWTIIKRGIGLLLMIIGIAIWGMWGLLVGMVLSIWLMYLINTYLVDVYIGYKMSRQLLDLLPTFLLSIIAFVISYFIGGVLPLGLYTDGIIKMIIYMTAYLSGSKLFELQSFTYAISLMRDFIKYKK
jgi:O-antigen/teichoic acid export membrane protein